MAREPGYCLHKPSGKAYVNLGGKVHYLGVYGTQESKEKYGRLKAEWLTNRNVGVFTPSTGPTMAEVVLAYLQHAELYYAGSTEYPNLELACRPVASLYASLYAKDFGIVQFETCRDWWLEDPKRSRQYINKQSKRLLRVLKWAATKRMVAADVYQECRLLAPLKAGRTAAPETEKISCVPQSVVDATLPFCTPVVADMIRFQQLVGCRPGELCSITPAMVDRSKEVWLIRLEKHKTAYRGRERVIYVGPLAQAILAKYLLRAGDAACFSPIESEKQRLQAKHDARVTPMSCGNRPGSNRTRTPRRAPRAAFDTSSYAHSIKGACKRAFPPPKLLTDDAKAKWHSDHSWSPNQLRHNTATAVRAKFGIEAASIILGHSDSNITLVYAEEDKSKAVSIAKAIG